LRWRLLLRLRKRARHEHPAMRSRVVQLRRVTWELRDARSQANAKAAGIRAPLCRELTPAWAVPMHRVDPAEPRGASADRPERAGGGPGLGRSRLRRERARGRDAQTSPVPVDARSTGVMLVVRSRAPLVRSRLDGHSAKRGSSLRAAVAAAERDDRDADPRHVRAPTGQPPRRAC
jgi:hypothetical protein